MPLRKQEFDIGLKHGETTVSTRYDRMFEAYATTPDGKEFKNWEAIYTRK